MILLGVILLIVGFLTHLAFLWTIGLVLIVVGVILAILGACPASSRPCAGRK